MLKYNIKNVLFIINFNLFEFNIIIITIIIIKEPNNSVGIATAYWLESRGSIPGRGKKFSLLHGLQRNTGLPRPPTLSPWR
jgi:hypothetical protein